VDEGSASGANARLAKRAYEAFNRGGAEAILEFLDPDVEWRMWERFARDRRTYRGHDGVREALAVFDENLDGFQADPHRFIEVGDRVVVPVSLRGRTKGTGEEQSHEVVAVWAVRDHRAAYRLDLYDDLEEAMEAARSAADRVSPA
jgi:ketosteroid isomerase-like protein